MTEPKKLYRNTSDKMMGGVCSGMAEYFELDVTLIRVLAVAIGLFTGGTAVVAYIIMLLITPEKPTGTTTLGKE